MHRAPHEDGAFADVFGPERSRGLRLLAVVPLQPELALDGPEPIPARWQEAHWRRHEVPREAKPLRAARARCAGAGRGVAAQAVGPLEGAPRGHASPGRSYPGVCGRLGGREGRERAAAPHLVWHGHRCHGGPREEILRHVLGARAPCDQDVRLGRDERGGRPRGRRKGLRRSRHVLDLRPRRLPAECEPLLERHLLAGARRQRLGRHEVLRFRHGGPELRGQLLRGGQAHRPPPRRVGGHEGSRHGHRR
mmetsp:Transcript_91544/g.179309  ORF Transcript_91544/g.179309 Transcript_91544/m.179309 type:complete len:250 (-) Transcript_91544:1568-2317(-)